MEIARKIVNFLNLATYLAMSYVLQQWIEWPITHKDFRVVTAYAKTQHWKASYKFYLASDEYKSYIRVCGNA